MKSKKYKKARNVHRNKVEQQIYLYIKNKLFLRDVVSYNDIDIKKCCKDDLVSAYEKEFKSNPIIDFNNNFKSQEEVNTQFKNKFSQPDGKSYIYFFITKDKNYVKIGTSKNLIKRLKTVQTGCPVKIEVVGWMEGGYAGEKEMHKRFNKLNTFGEWFVCRGSLMDYLIKEFNMSINHHEEYSKDGFWM